MSDLLLYRYIVSGSEKHVEVVCQKHYDAHMKEGDFFAPLTVAEIRQRKEQKVTPYTGPKPCELCAEEAEMRTVTGAA